MHAIAVAELVMKVTDNKVIIAAAYVHDVAEDTPFTLVDIADILGNEVASIVDQVTNVSCKKDGDRARRKALEREHIKNASPEAKTIKLGDIIDNTKNIHIENPEFAKIYIPEKNKMLDVLKEGNHLLYEEASRIMADYYRKH